MNSSADNIPDGDDKKNNGTEFTPENHSDHRPHPGNIQQLDEHITPVWEDKKVHIIFQCDSGSIPFIRSQDLFNKFPVGKVPYAQNGDSQKKSKHFFLLVLFMGMK